MLEPVTMKTVYQDPIHFRFSFSINFTSEAQAPCILQVAIYNKSRSHPNSQLFC